MVVNFSVKDKRISSVVYFVILEFVKPIAIFDNTSLALNLAPKSLAL